MTGKEWSLITILTLPLNLNRYNKVEIGLKSIYHLSGGWFSKYISQLITCGDEPDIQVAGCYSFSHKMEVYLNVLCSSMKDWIRRQVSCPKIITPQYGGTLPSHAKLSEKIIYPYSFSRAISQRFIHCLCTRSRDRWLLLRAPSNKVCANEHCKPAGGTPVVHTTAQSASVKILMIAEDDLRIGKPVINVPLTYRKIRLTNSQ
jgi:hypothetical protein